MHVDYVMGGGGGSNGLITAMPVYVILVLTRAHNRKREESI